MASPVFTRNPNFNPQLQQGNPLRPEFNAGGSVMTLENTLNKTIISFGVLLVAAALGWFVPAVTLPAAIIALVLGLVNSFKKEPSPGLIIAYAVFEGLMVGGFSALMERGNSGIVSQAVIGTLCVVGVVLFLYKSGLVRATPRMNKIFLVAISGYLLFSLVNFGLMLTGAVQDPWGLRGSVMIPGTEIPLGIALGVFAVILGSYSLIMDFDFIEHGVRQGLPEKYGWTSAFGIMVTVVWLYIEILRLIALSRR
jgi:uncharacterized YccA/Bax inhibitor family protein